MSIETTPGKSSLGLSALLPDCQRSASESLESSFITSYHLRRHYDMRVFRVPAQRLALPIRGREENEPAHLLLLCASRATRWSIGGQPPLFSRSGCRLAGKVVAPSKGGIAA